MGLPVLYTPFLRPPVSFEENSGEVIVEAAGYVPANVQIENMIYAGERLDYARNFDFPDGVAVEEDYFDPTRSPGFDRADADALTRSVSFALSEQRRLFEKEQADREAAAKLEAAASVVGSTPSQVT